MQVDDAATPSIERESEVWQQVFARVPMLLVPADAGVIGKLLREEDCELAAMAIKKVAQLPSVGPEWDRTVTGLRALATALATKDLPQDRLVRDLADAYEIELEASVDRFLADHQTYQAELEIAGRELETVDRNSLNQAMALVREALLEHGPDRPVKLREARSALSIGSTSGWMRHSSTWLAYGWVNLEIMGPTQEAINLFRHAVNAPRRQVLALNCIHRILSVFFLNQNDVTAAVSENGTALSLRSCLDTTFEAGALTAIMGRLGTTRSLLETATMGSPLFLMRALAAKAFTPMLPDLQAVAVKAHAHARQEGRQAVTGWAGQAKKVSEAEGLLGIQLPIGRDRVEGHEQLAEMLETGSLWQISAAKRYADDARDGLTKTAATAVSAEHRRRAEQVEAARKSIEAIMVGRDNELERQMEAEEAALSAFRERIRGDMAQGEKIQKSGVTTMGAGCGLFSLVMVGSAAAMFAGIQFSPTSSVGMSLMGLGALPAVGGIVMQVTGGLKRMALDGQLAAAEAKVMKERQRVGRLIDDQLRSKLDAARNQVTEGERGVLAAEQASQLLSDRRSRPTSVAA